VSFVFAAALAIALLVAVPVAAHLLRRGRAVEREFPPAHLVPSAPPVARQRSRLEDRTLLVIRGLLLVALALLGAIPLVRCSRLSLSREAGASVALAIVVDDSLSMRTQISAGGSRWERAIHGAEDLLRSAREGDAVSIVLAGRPARLVLAATTDLDSARRTLAELQVSDRPTDLGSAVQLARSALKQLPHVDKRVAVLSDLAGDDIPEGDPPPWIPLDELREPTSNCAIVQADRRGRRVTISVACSSAMAARGRRVEVVASEGEATPATSASAQPTTSGTVGSAALASQAGTQTMTVELDAPLVGLAATLTGQDGIEEDDSAPVAPEASALRVAVVADMTTSTVTTGGATLVEQALSALESGAQIRPLTLLPDEASELIPYAAIVLDDPVGFGPEARHAMNSWLSRGGVGLALVGPAIRAAQLGASLEPFVNATVPWAQTDAKGINPASAPWLGAEATSLTDLAPRGRAVLDAAIPSDARVTVEWDDSRPFLLERRVGRGLAITVGLPSATTQSDLALRPGFLALLQRIVSEAARRRGPRLTVAGSPWTFAGHSEVIVAGPDDTEAVLEGNGEAKVFTPARHGRYRVRIGDDVQLRIVTIDPEEVTRRPRDPAAVTPKARQGGVATQVDASRELAWIVILLFAAEVLLRGTTRWRRRRAAAR
jgi:hypothetical protein